MIVLSEKSMALWYGENNHDVTWRAVELFIIDNGGKVVDERPIEEMVFLRTKGVTVALVDKCRKILRVFDHEDINDDAFVLDQVSTSEFGGKSSVRLALIFDDPQQEILFRLKYT